MNGRRAQSLDQMLAAKSASLVLHNFVGAKQYPESAQCINGIAGFSLTEASGL
jgi:hypothetical protein